MNIEIVDFYPIEHCEAKGVLTGTLKIRLPDIGIQILGVYFSKRKDSYFFRLPGKNTTHHETHKEIWFPHPMFDNRKKFNTLMEAIKEQGRLFIEKKLAETANPLIFPPLKSRERLAALPKVNNEAVKDICVDEKPNF